MKGGLKLDIYKTLQKNLSNRLHIGITTEQRRPFHCITFVVSYIYIFI